MSLELGDIFILTPVNIMTGNRSSSGIFYNIPSDDVNVSPSLDALNVLVHSTSFKEAPQSCLALVAAVSFSRAVENLPSVHHVRPPFSRSRCGGSVCPPFP